MTPRIGELFAGYGGLGMGVQSVIGGEVVWFSEFDAAPSKILAHHFPGVPNHGDITKIDWSTVEPVDVLTGGFPCQDVSLAGARAGLMDGTRSGLWSEFAKAIDALRPGLVVIENVRGLLSAKTMEDIDEEIGDLESDPAGLGELGWGDRPVLNAFGRVLGDLAELGYDAQWVGLRAADAGAPHGRYRVFIVAHPHGCGGGWWAAESEQAESDNAPLGSGRGAADATQDPDVTTRDQRREPAPGQAEGGRARADARGRSGAPSPDTGSDGLCGDTERDSGPAKPGLEAPRRVHPDGCTAADTGRDESERWGGAGDVGGQASPRKSKGDQREWVREAAVDSGSGTGAIQWGAFEPAIARWELVTGRRAPDPTQGDGRDGSHRLSALFVEFMMGLPVGHVTNPAIGLTRNEQLKALGNGVVWQQAALAVRTLMERTA
ncbi:MULTISPECIES: DNA cytosine methyltransferase [unclassified Cryobacterium]|uniref:DNA cytosine methyltransferase n=1 Tax=unclassified Cryobacterium TaxID=2649013 RepID=UPI00106D5F9A|nr:MULTISPECIES: DNA cytosine methyltransferase [unclassified Cryobacterium]TFB96549.1 DNA cytosine methyltransferase [Cryobacterium sp. MDB2-A-1]TFC12833.1 DNA cytosine methyltransferase [Cryobacterium sp. MDB2-A-2]